VCPLGLDILLQKSANPALFHTIPEVITMYASLHDKHGKNNSFYDFGNRKLKPNCST